MQLTIQTRPAIAPEAVQTLDRLAELYAQLLHKLYAEVAAKSGRASDHKTAFCHEHGITARFFNGLANDLQGKLDGTEELLKSRSKDLKRQIRNLEGQLKRQAEKFKRVEQGTSRVTTKLWKSWPARQGKLKTRLLKTRHKLAGVEQRLAANVPGIGFGSRKLFKKQWFLKENGYSKRAEWLADWHAARANQVFFLGSGDETGGNQSCTLSVAEDLSLSLRIRLPDVLQVAGEKYLLLSSISFPFDEWNLRRALAAGTALSWRLYRDQKGWRLMVAFDRPEVRSNTKAARQGVLGIDFNADHLAVTETDQHGNFLESRRIELPFEGKSSGQRRALLSDALEEVVEWALELEKPIGIEKLDFERKKKTLASMSPAQARALSGLAYAQYQQLIASKCFRRGVELIKVNPVCTSIAGRIKYARPLGRSTHQAAAGVIGRRSQRLTERPPRAAAVTLHAHGTTVRFPLPARKDGQTSSDAWLAISRAWTAFLRKQWLATRAERSRPGLGAKGKSSGRSIAPRGPSGGTVPSAGIRAALVASMRYEQNCA